MAAKINWHRYGTKLRHCHPPQEPHAPVALSPSGFCHSGLARDSRVLMHIILATGAATMITVIFSTKIKNRTLVSVVPHSIYSVRHKTQCLHSNPLLIMATLAAILTGFWHCRNPSSMLVRLRQVLDPVLYACLISSKFGYIIHPACNAFSRPASPTNVFLLLSHSLSMSLPLCLWYCNAA